jgi:hypothetical protein
MLSQVLPIATRSLAHPVWASSATALDRPFAGAISSDIGATLLSFVRYCTVLACALVTAIITLSKQRAQKILSFLTGTAALISAGLIGYDLGYLRLNGYEQPSARADAINVAVIGLVLSCAMAIRAYKHVNSLRGPKSQMAAIAVAYAPIAALFIFLFAILISADPALLLAGLSGTGIPLSMLAIRKWRLGPIGQAGIAGIAAVIAYGFFAVVPAANDVDPTLALSMHGRVSSVERMLSDVRWAGSGSGSFDALLPIYRATDEADSVEIPTDAAIIAIEMGRPFLWTCVLTALVAAAELFCRGVLRGQDYVYPCAGAGCIAALLVLLFTSDGALGLGTSLMSSVACGLAFAQSKSSRNRDLSGNLSSVPDETKTRQNNPLWSIPDTWTKTLPRIALTAFGALLFTQATWILLTEGYRPNYIRLPVDTKTARTALAERNNIRRAASIAVVRGDLWAESAFTYSGKLWVDGTTGMQPDDQFNPEALTTLTRALRYSPHRGDVWLAFAALASQYKWSGYRPSLLLKMSYYTAPNEVALFPLRLIVSLHDKGMMDDAELRDMVKRDITVILIRTPALKRRLSPLIGRPRRKAKRSPTA